MVCTRSCCCNQDRPRPDAVAGSTVRSLWVECASVFREGSEIGRSFPGGSRTGRVVFDRACKHARVGSTDSPFHSARRCSGNDGPRAATTCSAFSVVTAITDRQIVDRLERFGKTSPTLSKDANVRRGMGARPDRGVERPISSERDDPICGGQDWKGESDVMVCRGRVAVAVLSRCLSARR